MNIEMEKRCILNFADREPFYRGQARLKEACQRIDIQADLICYDQRQTRLECPKHEVVPYGFKVFAMKKAQQEGYRFVLWCDSSIIPVRPLKSIWDILKTTGYFFHENGYTCGPWCSDAALVTLGISRDEAFTIPQIVGGCQGLDLWTRAAQNYLDQLFARATDGITFKGAWTNNNQEVSQDSRVKGHRHDQTAGSVIAWSLGMRDWQKNKVVYADGTDLTALVQSRPEMIFAVKGA